RSAAHAIFTATLRLSMLGHATASSVPMMGQPSEHWHQERQANMEEAEFGQKLAALLEEGREIGQMRAIAPTASIADKETEWIHKAFALARDVGADSVTITGGMPWNLSVSITFGPKK